MIIDKLEASTPFSSHTQADGSDVGGVPPVKYSVTPLPGKHPAWLFQTEGNTDSTGKGYPAVEFYPAASTAINATAVGRPILPNTGTLQFAFDLFVSVSTQAAANVIETDTILVIGGFKYNFSGQRHVATGQIDVGNWTDSKLRLGEISPNVKHCVVWTYKFDTTKKTGSVVSYECDGVVSPIAVLQNTPATACNWPDGAYPQFQQGSLPTGNPWSIKVKKVKYEWS